MSEFSGNRVSLSLFYVKPALNLKQVDFDYVAVNLIKDGGEQLKEDYMALNPIGQVPSLIDEDGNTFGQSVAILEFLEEKYPEPSLLPGSLSNRAKVTRTNYLTVHTSFRIFPL